MDGQTQTQEKSVNIFMTEQATSNPGFAPTPLEEIENRKEETIFDADDNRPVALSGVKVSDHQVDKMGLGDIQNNMSEILSDPRAGRVAGKNKIAEMTEVGSFNKLANNDDGTVKDVEEIAHAIEAIHGGSVITAAISSMAQDSMEGQDKKKDQSQD